MSINHIPSSAGRLAVRAAATGAIGQCRTAVQCARCLATCARPGNPNVRLLVAPRSDQEVLYRRRAFHTSNVLNKKKGGKDAEPESKSKEPVAEDPFDFNVLEKEINAAQERLKEALSKLRTGGRYNPEPLERLRVQPDKAEKTKIALSDLAQVIPKGRTVQIVVGEKEHVKAVSSAITTSDLQLTPHPDPTGQNPLLLEIKIPPPTAETRQLAVKEAAKAGEKATTAIRDARTKQHKKHRTMQSNKSIRPDDLRKAAGEMEKVVERAQAEVKKVVDNAKKMLETV